MHLSPKGHVFKLLLILISCVGYCKGEIERTIGQCCNDGILRGTNKEQCSTYSKPIPNIPWQYQNVCGITTEICCLQIHRLAMCSTGTDAGRLNQPCIKLPRDGGEYYKDCCDGCKVGIAVRGTGDASNCNLKSFDFSSPWAQAFNDCCHNPNVTAPSNNTLGTIGLGIPPTSTDSQHLQHPNTVPDRSYQNETTGNFDECKAFPAGQLCDHICIDTLHGYYCQCNAGYRLQSDAKTCVPGTDRCGSNNPCSQLCTDTGDAVICECNTGYELQNDRRTCSDIDECETEEDECDLTTQYCVNSIGSYQCINQHDGSVAPNGASIQDLSMHQICSPGYEFSIGSNSCKDIDECALGLDACDRSEQFCSNTEGSYVCLTKESRTTCPPGYKHNQLSATCLDVNECAEGLDACNREREFCLNLQGTYECQPKSQSSCPAGYKFNSAQKTCEDVDECIEKLHNCDPDKETCRNIVGAYECDMKCDQGFRFSITFRACTDINECLENLHDCEETTETCINMPGSYQCTTKVKAQCPAGYKPSNRDDGQCADVNECEENLHTCDPDNENCINEIGLYHCQPKEEPKTRCPEGHRSDPSIPDNCIDIDECVEEINDCRQQNAICINTVGSYRCHSVQCPRGYKMNITMKVCQDINECLEKSHNCTDGKEECVNVIGGFQCHSVQLQAQSCPTGHVYNNTLNACEDINECLLMTDTCNKTKEICLNTNGSFRCWLVQCPNGYRPNTTARGCEDIDECREQLHNCSFEETCINYRGGYSCTARPPVQSCPQGYRVNSETSNCEDVNECEENIHNCNTETTECQNNLGGFVCQEKPKCPRGFQYSVESRRCLDINECSEGLDSCDRDREMCLNSVGSFSCITNEIRCPNGYIINQQTKRCEDINECQQGYHNCLATQRCDNTIGSYSCIRLQGCGTGYTLNAHTSLCEDDDECVLGTYNCGQGWVCRNTLGSFRCDRKTCPHGHRLAVDGSCNVVQCDMGMRTDESGNCVDHNECETPNICRPHQRCVNTIGSYECQNKVNCGSGYELDTQGTTCQDIDECAKGIHECRASQECINHPGSYVCQCQVGYMLNAQRECEDINECTRYGKVCAYNAECENTPGSYACKCNEGFKHGDNDKVCIDIDECNEFGSSICQQTCINTWGSYQCTCSAGYTQGKDKRTCNDVDECTVYKARGNLCIGYCVNIPGSYSCNCPPGYKIGADKRICQDFDECAQGNICNGPNEVCLNTRGSYKCNRIECPVGYIRDLTHKNRCKRESTICPLNDEVCISQPLSYSHNYLTFVSNLTIPPTGFVNLFTMRGPSYFDVGADFKMDLKSTRAQQGIPQATRDYFQLRKQSSNQAAISLIKSIPGPQDIELELTMKLYRHSTIGGVAVAKLFIYVSEYDF